MIVALSLLTWMLGAPPAVRPPSLRFEPWTEGCPAPNADARRIVQAYTVSDERRAARRVFGVPDASASEIRELTTAQDAPTCHALLAVARDSTVGHDLREYAPGVFQVGGHYYVALPIANVRSKIRMGSVRLFVFDSQRALRAILAM